MKSNRILIIVAGIFISGLNATSQSENVIYEQKIYKSVNGKDLTADIFYTNNPQKEKRPGLALFHGGGWIFGSPEEFHETCRRYARKGLVAISFQYRLSINDDGSYPDPEVTLVECVKDARSAMRWMRERAAELGIDQEKIIAGGQSAGGQLALSTVLMDDINENTDNLKISTEPNALLLFSSNVNTLEAWIDMIMGDRRDEIWSVSPHHNIKKNMPPAIAFHGEDDCMVLPYIVDMFKVKMEQFGNPYELITFPGRGHYLGQGNEKYATYFDEEILELADNFLEEHGFMN